MDKTYENPPEISLIVLSEMLVNNVDDSTIGYLLTNEDGTEKYQPVILWNIRVVR